MTKVLACVIVALLPLAGCGSDDDGGSCAAAACLADCRTGGYTAGSCIDGSCRCSGSTDADADGDGDARDEGGGGDDGRADDGGGRDRCSTTGEYSFIWIADTGEGKVSKLCTLDGVEVGRFWSSPQLTTGDPSRTSVNLHGDAVVTNRDTSGGPSSVTKFAGLREDCVDRNGDTIIQTSTGPTDVLDWGEDECMLWNSPLNVGGSSGIGARATAWDGTEDAATGHGGFVWIGALTNGQVYKLNGDTGEIVAETHVTNQPYGGVIDGRGSFWIVGAFCTIGVCQLSRVNLETLAAEYVAVPCGYGISADRQGRIWTSGRTMTGSCVNRLDPTTGENVTYTAAGMMNFFRGIAVDNRGSVWVANTGGNVLQVSEADVTLLNDIAGVGTEAVVGVAVDFQFNIWAVSQGGNAAVKINPTDRTFVRYPVGSQPYTYSDMTGYQLRTVILIK
jgi:hypothetical protein